MFAKIPDKFQGGSRVWGHKDAVAAFVRMAEDAEANGYKLKIVSAFRSFSDQKQIWEDKWTGKTLVGGKKLNVSMPDPKERATKILTYSSMPATSRHHWGTDFDINSVDPKFFTTRTASASTTGWSLTLPNTASARSTRTRADRANAPPAMKKRNGTGPTCPSPAGT